MDNKNQNKGYAGVLIAITNVGELRKVFLTEEYDYEGFLLIRPAEKAGNATAFMLPNGSMGLFNIEGRVETDELLDIAVNADIPDAAPLPLPVAPIFSKKERADKFVRRVVVFAGDPSALSEEMREAIYRGLVYQYTRDGYLVDVSEYVQRLN